MGPISFNMTPSVLRYAVRYSTVYPRGQPPLCQHAPSVHGPASDTCPMQFMRREVGKPLLQPYTRG